MSLAIRTATMDDFDDIVEVGRQGREALAGLGIDQWRGGTPTPAQVAGDIEGGHALVAYDEDDPDAILGWLAYYECGESDYANVYEGAWLTTSSNGPDAADYPNDLPVTYAVAHRVAVAARARRRGVASFLVGGCAELARAHGLASVRVDTHEGNIPMQTVFGKLGFVQCCRITIVNDLEPTKERLGFELLI